MRKFCYIGRVLGKEGASHPDLGSYVSLEVGLVSSVTQFAKHFAFTAKTALFLVLLSSKLPFYVGINTVFGAQRFTSLAIAATTISIHALIK